MGAELGIAVGHLAVGRRLFLPQRQQGQALAFELVLDRVEVRQRLGRLRPATAAALEAALEVGIVPVRQQRPAQPQLAGPAGVFHDHALRDPASPG